MTPQEFWSAHANTHLCEGSTAWDADLALSHEQTRRASIDGTTELPQSKKFKLPNDNL